MEHLVIQLVRGLIRWLNLRAQKPLAHVVPDFHLLQSDPAQFLKQQPVYIGPWRKWGNVVAVTGFFSIVLWVVYGFGIMKFLNRAAPGLRPFTPALCVAICLGGPFVVLLVSRRYFFDRAGEVALHADGLVLSCHNEKVYCPWHIFDTPGAPVRVGRDRVVVPLAGDAGSQVITEKDGAVVDGQAIATRPFTLRPGDEAVLQGLYEVDISELALLLLNVGRGLGRSAASRKSASVAASNGEPVPSEVGWLEKNGWVRVRLTRLVFPSHCSACGQATIDAQEVAVQSFADADSENAVKLRVPICIPCQQDGSRLGRKHLATGCATTALAAIAFLVTFVVLAVAGFSEVVLFSTFVAGAIVSVLLLVRSSSLRRRARSPAEVKSFSQRDAMVSLRFRNPGYADLLLQPGAALRAPGAAGGAIDIRGS